MQHRNIYTGLSSFNRACSLKDVEALPSQRNLKVMHTLPFFAPALLLHACMYLPTLHKEYPGPLAFPGHRPQSTYCHKVSVIIQ